ncbi:hypothetical protein [Rhodococcus sp. IEGM 1330]|uniref:hypothetical protein n=1 Tax=Rhodococcus sp. IEGM 1330 TaxID=3082225 RepID=UPI002955153E|nr:hypothetical protein [Rhodococcus sp. IEGM 1330]MDV8025342.1 hypothetical protein [Rhodococcus sp. IEGM 1330]
MTPFGVQVVVGIVALASLALGLYNLWFAKRAPVRDRQRELEDEIRGRLEQVILVMESASKQLKRGEYSAQEVPPIVKDTSEALKPLVTRVKDSELSWRAKNASDHLFLLDAGWSRVASGYKYPDQHTEKKVAALESALKDQILVVCLQII